MIYRNKLITPQLHVLRFRLHLCCVQPCAGLGAEGHPLSLPRLLQSPAPTGAPEAGPVGLGHRPGGRRRELGLVRQALVNLQATLALQPLRPTLLTFLRPNPGGGEPATARGNNEGRTSNPRIGAKYFWKKNLAVS